MALPSFLQHLTVLEECGVIRTRKSGRVRQCRLVPGSLATAEHWLAAQRVLWQRRLDQLDTYLTELKEQR
jgi:DNA-binding transcriptional ArsR family regulator